MPYYSNQAKRLRGLVNSLVNNYNKNRILYNNAVKLIAEYHKNINNLVLNAKSKHPKLANLNLAVVKQNGNIINVINPVSEWNKLLSEAEKAVNNAIINPTPQTIAAAQNEITAVTRVQNNIESKLKKGGLHTNSLKKRIGSNNAGAGSVKNAKTQIPAAPTPPVRKVVAPVKRPAQQAMSLANQLNAQSYKLKKTGILAKNGSNNSRVNTGKNLKGSAINGSNNSRVNAGNNKNTQSVNLAAAKAGLGKPNGGAAQKFLNNVPRYKP